MNKQKIMRELEQLLDDPRVVESPTVDKIDAMLWVLYPRGVRPVEYMELVRTVRVLEHLCNIQESNDEVQTRASSHSEREQTPPAVDAHVGASIPQLFRTGISTKTSAADASPAQAEKSSVIESVIESVEDDTTAPIINPALYSQSPSYVDKPWTKVARPEVSRSTRAGSEGMENRTSDPEHVKPDRSNADYTSIFKIDI